MGAGKYKNATSEELIEDLIYVDPCVIGKRRLIRRRNRT